MDPQAYIEMAEIQQEHWWFKARREILSSAIESLNLKKGASILEIGCGTGGNIEMLKQHGQLSAIEMDQFAENIQREIRGCL